MATLVTKNSSTASAVPGTGDLVQGELAVNVTDKRLFTKNAGGTVVEVGTNPSTIENNLLIGTTSNVNNRRLLVNGTGSGATYTAVGDSAQTANQIVVGIEPSSTLSWLNSTSWSLALGTGGTERVRITTVGDFIPTLQTSVPTLTANQQMVFTLTSNTNLRISVRGSDGVTRTANITLS